MDCSSTVSLLRTGCGLELNKYVRDREDGLLILIFQSYSYMLLFVVIYAFVPQLSVFLFGMFSGSKLFAASMNTVQRKIIIIGEKEMDKAKENRITYSEAYDQANTRMKEYLWG